MDIHDIPRGGGESTTAKQGETPGGVLGSPQPGDAPRWQRIERIKRIAQRIKGIIWRFATPIFLLLAVVSAIAAYQMLPKDASVAAKGTITNVEVDAYYVPSNINVTIKPNILVHGVDVSANVYSPSMQLTHASITLQVPPQTFGGLKGCVPNATCNLVGKGLSGSETKTLTVEANRVSSLQNAPNTTIYYQQTPIVTLPGVTYNVAANREYAAANIPNVAFYVVSPPSTFTPNVVPVAVNFSLGQPFRYSWTSGVAPSIGGDLVAWHGASSVSFAATGANGIALSIQDQNARRLFYAGILFGIAGGALLASAQAFLAPAQEYRKRKGGSG